MDVFWISPRPDSPVGSYQFPVIIRSCDQISLVRPHFCNQQNTDLRSAHNTHTGTQLAWAHIKVMWSSREKELGNACCRHSMPWSNAIFKRRCQTVANGCQPRNQGGFLRRSKLRSSDNRLLIVYAGSRLGGTSLDWSLDRCQNCVYSHQGTFPRKAV